MCAVHFDLLLQMLQQLTSTRSQILAYAQGVLVTVSVYCFSIANLMHGAGYKAYQGN